jgi:hypothetical protein
MNELNPVVHITIFNIYVLIFYSSMIIVCYIMYTLNIRVARCDNIMELKT